MDGTGQQRLRIELRGVVQGVGFRPFLYRRATRLGLAGWVANGGDGLVAEVEGAPAAVARFVDGLKDEAPALARIDAVESRSIAVAGTADFRIAASSVGGEAVAGVLPDVATCPACLAEIDDPANRRHRYPFTSCATCGPRYSIIETLPYDRCRTAMAPFDFCADCRAEYEDPGDRRFHAEASACPRCGPTLALLDGRLGARARGDDALRAAVRELRAGRILALKGLGGYQLVADARNDDAVAGLRRRKRRPDKPFALLVAGLDAARDLASISADEARALTGPEAPIVLLRRATGAVAPSVAPGNPWLGIMLPATGLHHLLARDFGGPLVATSGNAGDEPLLHDDDAPRELAGLADVFLVHDRAILRPVDDSVLRLLRGRPMLLRRARGFAPTAVALPGAAAGILGAGGHLKNTVAVSLPGRVLVGPHVGDLGSTRSRAARRRSSRDLTGLAGLARLRAVARDLHPDYAADEAGEHPGVVRVSVQHHVAHVAACMAEHGLDGPLLGVAWDGAGLGADGTIWGGEFLQIADGRWQRVARLRDFRLPGGERAMREPWRAAAGLLHAVGGAGALVPARLPFLGRLEPAARGVLAQAIARGVNAPVTSSAGRLFDAASALLDLCPVASYEGQAAAMLEWAADGAEGAAAYDFPLLDARAPGEPLVVDVAPALAALLADRDAGVGVPAIARRWHEGLARAIVAVARFAAIERVALVGGCFQNRLLLERAAAYLEQAGFTPRWPERIPPNDGGLSLGQVAWAARIGGEAA